jgi:hypothetical protein
MKRVTYIGPAGERELDGNTYHPGEEVEVANAVADAIANGPHADEFRIKDSDGGSSARKED